jgi:hypothetical protein
MGGDPSRYADGASTAWQLSGFSPDTDELTSQHPVSRGQFLALRGLFATDY